MKLLAQFNTTKNEYFKGKTNGKESVGLKFSFDYPLAQSDLDPDRDLLVRLAAGDADLERLLDIDRYEGDLRRLPPPPLSRLRLRLRLEI